MTSPTTPSKPTKPAYKRLNVARRAEAIALWKSGTMTLEELSKKFKVSIQTLHTLFKREGAEKGQTAERTKKLATEAVDAAIMNEATIYAQRVKDTKEEHYKMAATLSKLIYSRIIKTEKEGKSPNSISGDIKSYHLAVMALKVAREERYATLGIRPDDVADEKPLPDLIVQELTVEDIQEMSKSNMVTDDEGDFDFEDGGMGDEELVDKEEKEDKVILE